MTTQQGVQVKKVHELFSLKERTNLKHRRAGFLVYRIDENGEKRYLLGIDNDSGDHSDFGGHPEPEDRDSIDTAMRECPEETLGVLPKIDRRQLSNDVAIFRDDVMIILTRLNYDPTTVIKLFEQRKKKQERLETVRLVEVDRETLLKMIKTTGTLYELIRILLRDALKVVPDLI